MRIPRRSPAIPLFLLPISIFLCIILSSSSAVAEELEAIRNELSESENEGRAINATKPAVNGSAKGSFAEMFDEALRNEFSESEHEIGETDPGGFNNSVTENQCSDKVGQSLELGSFAAGVMISTTDLSQHTLEQVEPIRNFFAALFLASIGMLIHVHFLWNHVDILLAAVILVIVVKTIVVTITVKGFGYTNKTSLLVGMSLAQIGEFSFVLLSRASNLHLVEVTTPLMFKLIPAVIHLGVLL